MDNKSIGWNDSLPRRTSLDDDNYDNTTTSRLPATATVSAHGIKESGYQQYAKSPHSTTTAPVQYTVGNGTPIDIAKYYTNAPPVHYNLHLVGNGIPNDIAKVVPSNFYCHGM